MALALSAWIDRSSVKAGEVTSAHLVVEVSASAGVDVSPRPPAPSAVVLAVDVSGSMNGEPLAHVVRSVDALVDAMGARDRLGVVAFSDGATRVAPPVPMDADGKRLVRARVARLVAEGNTNVEAGLELAATELRAASGLEPHARRGVVLLTDGVPNRGALFREPLCVLVDRLRAEMSVAALGYGIDHDEDLLAAVGEAGGGGYAFVPDPIACARAFARALGAHADVVASGLELTLAPFEGAEIVRFVGRESPRYAAGGVVVPLEDMMPGSRRVVVAEISVRASREAFLARVAQVSLRATRVGVAAREPLEVVVEVADREPAVVAAARARVLLVRAEAAREEARLLADRRQFGAAAACVRALLAEIDALPGFAHADGSPLAEAYELLVDEAIAFERAPSPEAYAAFRKAAVESRLTAQPGATSLAAASSRLLEHAAGRYPQAALVIVTGPGRGERHRLRRECVIGRTASADVALESASVARRHAEIYAEGGAFWISDLGSTSATEHNGERLGTTPARLRNGDVVRIGDVELRYEENLRTSP